MKIYLFIMLLTVGVSSLAHSYSVNKKVLLRIPGTQQTKEEIRTLSGLLNPDYYESEYFKIVLGKSDNAIGVNFENSDVQLKAASVYYHLMKAREFFINIMDSERAKNLHKLTVRLEITNGFSDLAHFLSDKMEPEYNNALSVPGGVPPDFVPNTKPWKEEIWFRPMKKISTANLPDDQRKNPLTIALRQWEDMINDFAFGQFRNATIRALIWDRYRSSYWKDVAWAGGTFVMMKVIMENSYRLDPLFLSAYYYLDMALVPEVVFHEYTHIILSDKLALSHSTAVIEGMADFFAANIASNHLVYGMVPGRSNSKPKDALNQIPYTHLYEHISQASADFVLSVLWAVKKALPEVSEKLVYNARNFLSTKSANIYDSLLRALLKSCNQVCENPMRDKHKLYEAFKSKGF